MVMSINNNENGNHGIINQWRNGINVITMKIIMSAMKIININNNQ
jgi:hypothetical protein